MNWIRGRGKKTQQIDWWIHIQYTYKDVNCEPNIRCEFHWYLSHYRSTVHYIAHRTLLCLDIRFRWRQKLIRTSGHTMNERWGETMFHKSNHWLIMCTLNNRVLLTSWVPYISRIITVHFIIIFKTLQQQHPVQYVWSRNNYQIILIIIIIMPFSS